MCMSLSWLVPVHAGSSQVVVPWLDARRAPLRTAGVTASGVRGCQCRYPGVPWRTMTPHTAPQLPPAYSNTNLRLGIRETPDLYREENETDLTDAEILADVFANTLETILAIFINEDITPAYLAATMKAHAYCGEESELLPADLIPALLAGIRSRKADLGEDVNARIAELMDEVGEDE